MTPVMLAEYVPPDFDTQQRQSAEEALAKHRQGKRARLRPRRDGRAPGRHLSRGARRGEAIGADLIVMSSHRPAMRTYFLGSNAGHVVRYAKCSVLVVRGSASLRRLAAKTCAWIDDCPKAFGPRG